MWLVKRVYDGTFTWCQIQCEMGSNEDEIRNQTYFSSFQGGVLNLHTHSISYKTLSGRLKRQAATGTDLLESYARTHGTHLRRSYRCRVRGVLVCEAHRHLQLRGEVVRRLQSPSRRSPVLNGLSPGCLAVCRPFQVPSPRRENAHEHHKRDEHCQGHQAHLASTMRHLNAFSWITQSPPPPSRVREPLGARNSILALPSPANQSVPSPLV